MSEEQLSALLAKLKDDAGLQEKLKAAADLDAAVALAKEAGFDVSKADWLRFSEGSSIRRTRLVSSAMRSWKGLLAGAELIALVSRIPVFFLATNPTETSYPTSTPATTGAF